MLVAIAAAGLLAGCGTSKTGGTITVLETAGGIDSLDPGYWYYQTDYADLGLTTQRWLYSWPPNATTPAPDLAEAMPKVSDGGRTLTIRIRPGIHYSPPLAGRTVAAADVKYALERCFLPQVANGYAAAYYGDIAGVSAFTSGRAKEISGIEAPDARTLVIHTVRPVGVLASGAALALPCTVPVPKSYAGRYDSGRQSTYGQHQVFTGPYMIEGAGSGSIGGSGYQPGRKLVLVRNPSWRRAPGSPPASFDRIVFSGGWDPTVAARKTLGGHSLVEEDTAPPPAVLKQALRGRRGQLAIEPSQGVYYVALDTRVKPLDNVDVRRAIAAVVDKAALRATGGGAVFGHIATHFIPPGMPGFEEAGGLAGPGYDFDRASSGELRVAGAYMKRAGYRSGRYDGPPLLAVAGEASPASNTAQLLVEQLAQLGIRLNFRELTRTTMFTKFCGVPRAAVAICPSMMWAKDFFDSQSMLDPVFDGDNIVPSGNVNTAEVNDPAVNAALERAAALTDPAARARAYGELDRKLTAQAYVIPWVWNNAIISESSNVRGIYSRFSTEWDLAWSGLR